MPRLMLLRHAKSSWDEPLPDHERPLSSRGHRATHALREHLIDVERPPDLVLCSTAARTVATWEGIAGAFDEATPVELRTDLYGAPPDDLLAAVRGLPFDVGCVMVIADNPGMEDLAIRLAGHGDDEIHRRMWAKYPTGALATFDVTSVWTELETLTATLVDFVTPRELEQPDA